MNLNKFKGYTPGPWGISRHFATLIEASGGRGICSAGGYSDNHNADRVYAENHANAALIAAAPDLLAYAKRLEAENKRLRDAAGPFAEFIDKFDAKPIRSADDEFYGIHTGSQWEASIRLSQFRALRKALEATP